MFIVIEGVDGAGKTTFAKMLIEVLEKRNLNYLHTRQPGGCPGSENIRTLVKENTFTYFTDLLLMFGARTESLANTIIPALNRKEIVICERYNDSTYAYQVFEGNELIAKTFNYLEAQINNIAKPDLVIYLESDIDLNRNRIEARGEPLDRFESNEYFQRKCQRGFNIKMCQKTYNYHVIPAQDNMESLSEQVDKVVEQFIISDHK